MRKRGHSCHSKNPSFGTCISNTMEQTTGAAVLFRWGASRFQPKFLSHFAIYCLNPSPIFVRIAQYLLDKIFYSDRIAWYECAGVYFTETPPAQRYAPGRLPPPPGCPWGLPSFQGCSSLPGIPPQKHVTLVNDTTRQTQAGSDLSAMTGVSSKNPGAVHPKQLEVTYKWPKNIHCMLPPPVLIHM